MHGPDVTSELRTKLAGAICAAVEKGDTVVKLGLAVELATLPFENMTDDALVEMALHYCEQSVVEAVVTSSSSELHTIRAEFHCGACLDQKVVKGEDERWRRCRNCNVDETKEPKVSA